MKTKKSQIWVETAIYTLIGLTLIAIVLAIANPQIEKMKDRSSVTQAMDALETLDGKLYEVEQSPGSISIPQVRVSKGKIIINSTNDSLNFLLEGSSLEFSQEGVPIKEGNFIITTIKKGNRFNIYITRNYNGIDITYNSQEKDIFLESSSTPYRIKMENKGKNTLMDKTVIDFNKL